MDRQLPPAAVQPPSRPPHRPDRRGPFGALRLRGLTAALAALAFGAGLAAPAYANPSEDAKKADQQLDQAQDQLGDSSTELDQASAALDKARSKLSAARDELARLEGEVDAAKQKDQEMAAQLAEAQEKLEQAKAAVKANSERVERHRALIGDVVRDQYQQQNGLVGMAMVVDDTTAGTLQTRMQWSTTMFDTAQAKMDALEDAQRKLEQAKKVQAQAEQQAEEDRQAAADNLANLRQLESQAADEEAEITDLVAANKDAEKDLSTQVQRDQKRVAEMKRESAAADKKLAEFEAEQEKKAVDERKAREARAKERAEAKKKTEKEEHGDKDADSGRKTSQTKRPEEPSKKEATAKKKSSSSKPRNATKATQAPAVSPIAPGQYRISATYGETGLWARYHTGLDFAGTGVGTPVRAIKDGVVMQSSAGSWAGRHVILRHKNGESTLYAHFSGRNVKPGQVVRKGDLIGWTGATGNVTGPHLHLEYYPRGASPGSVYEARNPRDWLASNRVKV